MWSRYYRNHALVILTLVEVYCSVDKSIESVVLTLCYTSTWEMLVTTLTNDDIACYYRLTTEDLNTKSLSC